MSTWFYYDTNGQKQGPVTGGQLKWLAKGGMITPETIVETENGKTAHAGKVKGLTFNVTPETSQETSAAMPSAWYYYDDFDNKQGPFDIAQLETLAAKGIITPETFLETDAGRKGKANQMQRLFPDPPEVDPYISPIASQTVPLAVPWNDSAPVEMPKQFQSLGNINEKVHEFASRGYRNPGSIANTTVVVSNFLIIATIIMIFCLFMEHDVLTKIQAGAYATTEEMEAAANSSDSNIGKVGLISLVSILASRVLLCFWTYRFVKNAHSISSRPLRFGPGWAVGYYFIPILNLFRPYQALSDAYRASKNPSDWVSAPPSNLLTFWWALFLLVGFAGHAIARRTTSGLEIDALVTLNAWTTLTYLVLDLPFYVLTICIIWKLTDCQKKTYLKLVYSPQSPMETTEYTQPIPVDEWVFPANTSGWAIAAGYAGLFAVLVFPAPVALILGIIALWDCKKRSIDGKGRAIFAIIMGSIFSLLLAFFLVVLYVESLS